MAMAEKDLAKKLHEALAQKEDGEGKPTPVSSQTQEYASGYIAALKASTVAHAAGLVTATGTPATPIADGAATMGLFVGLVPAPMLAKTQVGAPGPFSVLENTAVINYVLANATITFDSGTITGTCTATPTSPGPLVAGAGTMGYVEGLDGSACSDFVASQTGLDGPDMEKHYTALMDYTIESLEVEYLTGSVIGSFATGGGPMIAGTGVGGIVS